MSAKQSPTWCYWVPEWDETEADARSVGDFWGGWEEAYTAERVASKILENQHEAWDYPEELTLVVKSPSGRQWEVLVYAEPSICFKARSKTIVVP